MEIVSWLVFTGMSSLVATGSSDSGVAGALPKLKLYGEREVRANQVFTARRSG